jgi:hypothetical protein
MARTRKVVQRDPFGRLESTYEEEESNDILRDGETLRVPLYLKDGSPNLELTPLQRLVATSQNKLLVSDGTDDPLALNRPGFRYSTDAAQRADAASRLAEAYEAKELADAEAWRSHDDHLLNTSVRSLSRDKKEGDRCVPDQQQDAQSVGDAYAEYDLYMQNAWRRNS